MDNIPIALLIVRPNHQIITANKQSHALFGYDAGELVGQQLEILVPPDVRSRHVKMAEEYWNKPHAQIIGSGRDLQGVKKDGTLIPVEIGLYPYHGNVMVVVVDITVRHVKKLTGEIKTLADKMQKTAETLERVTAGKLADQERGTAGKLVGQEGFNPESR